MTTPDSSKKQDSPRKQWAKFYLMISPFILFLVGALVGIPLFNHYDSTHLVSLECTVESASPREGSLRFGGQRVQIETQECGLLSYAWGVNGENVAKIADTFEVGELYDFQVGKLTGGTFKPVKQLWGGSVRAHSYELLTAD